MSYKRGFCLLFAIKTYGHPIQDLLRMHTVGVLTLSLNLWFRSSNSLVSLRFAPCLIAGPVTAVLLSFLQVFGTSGEYYHCENEVYDTAGWSWSRSVNGSLNDSWAFSQRYQTSYQCQEHKVSVLKCANLISVTCGLHSAHRASFKSLLWQGSHRHRP